VRESRGEKVGVLRVDSMILITKCNLRWGSRGQSGPEGGSSPHPCTCCARMHGPALEASKPFQKEPPLHAIQIQAKGPSFGDMQQRSFSKNAPILRAETSRRKCVPIRYSSIISNGGSLEQLFAMIS